MTDLEKQTFDKANALIEKNKQIEEMAKALTRYEYSLCERLPKNKCLLTSAIHAQVSCDYCKIAEFLYNEGYRKASEVARVVIADMREMIKGYENIDVYLDRIEKKYINN